MQNGPLSAYSTRSLERSIGKYKKLIKSKSLVGENAGNVMERLATRSYINTLPWEINEKIELLTARPYKSASFETFTSADTGTEIQMWEPFLDCCSNSLPCDVPGTKFIDALSNLYLRPSSDFNKNQVINIRMSPRIWALNTVYNSDFYADSRKEHRRGDSFIMFDAVHQKLENDCNN